MASWRGRNPRHVEVQYEKAVHATRSLDLRRCRASPSSTPCIRLGSNHQRRRGAAVGERAGYRDLGRDRGNALAGIAEIARFLA